MKKSFTLLVFMLFCGAKIFAQCPNDIKVNSITYPTCGNNDGKFTVLLSNHSSPVEVSLDGGITFSPFGGAGTTGGSLAFTGLTPNIYHIVVRVAGSTTICQSFDFVLRAKYGSAYTAIATTASNCTANGSIKIGNGVLATDSVSWISSLTPTFVTAGSLSGNTIPNLAPGLYYVTFKSPASNYCYSIDTVSVQNTGTACPAATFCGNATDPTNLFPNGTFGSGGNADGTNAQINGPALAPGITQYTYQPLGALAPEDGFYAIASNTFAGSDIGSTPFNGSWYNGYDHDYWATGGTSGGIKNGYQMVVNASIDPDIVIQKTVDNLCPNKKYQFSAWIRDLNSNATQIPANLTFLVNGVGLYTTGNINPGNGNGGVADWKQVGFTFQPTGNTATISIRNNQGGGAGNDWAIDDIYVGDCVPTVAMQPIIFACNNMNPPTTATAIITDGSQFYDTYEWLVNRNNGLGFVPEGGIQTATFNSSTNSYTASIGLPDIPSNPAAYQGWRYQVVVGTTSSDLTSPTCSYTSAQSLLIQNCDVILPVKITDIKAQFDNNNGEVIWSVADQLNVNKYELEKSGDNKNFSFVTAAVANTNISSYTAVDNHLSEGITYYRIKEVDNNGAISYSKVVTLAWDGPSGTINIFPNPVSTQLFIATPSNTKIINATVIDAIGRIVLQANTAGNPINTIDASNLAPGFYTLKMVTGKNEVVNKSFIKK